LAKTNKMGNGGDDIKTGIKSVYVNTPKEAIDAVVKMFKEYAKKIK